MIVLITDDIKTCNDGVLVLFGAEICLCFL